MFRRLSNMLKRAEIASDMMVLESSPDSPRAAKIRAKYEKEAIQREVRAYVTESLDERSEIIAEAMKINAEHVDWTGEEALAEAERRVNARKNNVL